jgi:acetylornithine deacetylase
MYGRMQSAIADTVSILKQLVAFPTVSADSNLALIAWVEEFLDQQNIPHWRVNEGPNKSSLLARIGPNVAGGIVLSGHTDVVPVKDQPWDTDPFELVLKGDKYFGRGTSDMKAFLALSLAAIPLFNEAKLTKPVWLAFSHDEEIGCLGAAPMAQALIAKQAHPSLVVIGEPTSMQLVGAHKGIWSYETIVTGREAHSSMPEQGVNAVMIMGELIATLNKIAADCRAEPAPLSGFPSAYTTVHVGTVEGGTARNIIPRYARIAWEVRPLPGVDVQTLLTPFHERVIALEAQMKRTDPETGILTRQLTQVHGLGAPTEKSDYLPLACRLAGSNHAHAVSYGTEGGIFQNHGFPVIVCGPGSIDQAHQPNEWIEANQLELGMGFMARVAESLR